MSMYDMPMASQELYRARYEDKAVGTVPGVMIGVDYGDEPDTCVYSVYSVDRSTGKMTCLEVAVKPTGLAGFPHG